MSAFSTKLSEYISASGQTIYALAISSGVDRSLIHRMMKGERTPSKKDTVLALSRALLLTATETAELVEAYEIARLGEGTYLELRYIRQMLAEIGKILLKNRSTPRKHLFAQYRQFYHHHSRTAGYPWALGGQKAASPSSPD